MTIDEMIAVLQAYKGGKKIQWYDELSCVWIDLEEPNWNISEIKYRIKPEPRYRPFESAKEVMEAIREHGDYVNWREDESWKLRVIAIHDEHVQFGYNNIIDHDVALREWLFCDGTPFGKPEEE